ncbi:hypothetical protein KXD93_25805 [Mucilaginibacter sp. BJC16-A38]|uniref:hypothetical protein n=1 Tax=Mucilaginibacter phenanthrenivorans TaxID=1234842 RepID=UPI002156FC27|nr:hypothetical protein [Mucilaginibacter phenanthrenivorans]MCR8561099.1 hypothetical protein [Mucilaginibacter phenanthrenivorans]
MKTLLNRWFIASCLIWLIVISTRKLGHPILFINGYIDDAIAIPVIASLALCFQRVVIFKSNYYVLSVWHVVFITAYVTLVFEVLLPLISKTYTGDWIDALLYSVGAVFFYRVMNKALLETRDL